MFLTWICWAVLFLCVCRKLSFYLEHIHLEGQGLKGVAGGNQKQNILYVLSFFVLKDTLFILSTGSLLEHDLLDPLYSVFMLGIALYISMLQ